jgi:hypothetical protein
LSLNGCLLLPPYANKANTIQGTIQVISEAYKTKMVPKTKSITIIVLHPLVALTILQLFSSELYRVYPYITQEAIEYKNNTTIPKITKRPFSIDAVISTTITTNSMLHPHEQRIIKNISDHQTTGIPH